MQNRQGNELSVSNSPALSITKISSEEYILEPITGYFENVLTLLNDFTINSVKFILGEKDLSVFNLHDIFRVTKRQNSPPVP